MWTRETRAKYDRRDLRYPSDLRKEEGAELEPLLPKWNGRGRPPEYPLREIINSLRYVLRDGIPWEALPTDLPPWYLGSADFRKLGGEGRLDPIQQELLMKDREQSGREPSPTVAILDSQTIKCDAPQGEPGSDGAKKRVGRKRHVAVDTGGRSLTSTVTCAEVPDQEAGWGLAAWLVRLCPWIEIFIVDHGYKKTFCEAICNRFGRTVQVAERPKNAKGFVVIPNRWKVEQTVGVRVQNRRLRTDYESLMSNSLAMLTFASIFRLIISLAA